MTISSTHRSINNVYNGEEKTVRTAVIQFVHTQTKTT